MTLRILIGMATILLAVADSDADARGCRSGTSEYARQQVGPNRIRIYCVCNADIAAMKEVDATARQLEDKIRSNRSAIERWQSELPGFMQSLDEWVRMDERARMETRARALDAALTSSLGMVRIHAQRNVQVTQAEMQILWQEFNATALGSPRFYQILQEQGAGAAIIRKWQKYDEFAQTMDNLQNLLNGMNAAQREEYGRALLNVLALGLKDPRLSVLAAELDFAATAFIGNVTARFARVRVRQLVNLGGERLKAVSSLTALYRRNVDALAREKSKRERLLRRANDPDATCLSGNVSRSVPERMLDKRCGA